MAVRMVQRAFVEFGLTAEAPIQTSAYDEVTSPLSFEPTHKSLLLEHHVHCFDDSNLRICFTIDNHFMLELFRSGDIKEMLLCETIVPATVPSGEPVSVSLPSSRKCGAGQCLHVNVPLGICICSEVYLSLNVRTRCPKDRHCKN